MKRRCQAFTLTELLIGLGLSSLFLSLFAMASVHYYRGITDSADLAVRMEGQSRILDYLARDLRSASAAKVTATGTRLIVVLPNNFEEPGVMAPPLIPSLQQIIYGTGTMQVTYSTLDGYFQRDNGTKVQLIAAMPTGSSVIFAYKGAASTQLPPITATVTVQQVRPRQTLTYVAKRTFNPQANATILP